MCYFRGEPEVPKMKAVGKSQTVKILDSGDSVWNLNCRQVWERKLWHCLFLGSV